MEKPVRYECFEQRQNIAARRKCAVATETRSALSSQQNEIYKPIERLTVTIHSG